MTLKGQVLVVQHETECPPALLGDWLEAAGVALDIRRPYEGEPLPESAAEHDGLLILGGHMGVNEDATHPWLTTVKALVREAAELRTPTLGVCLGHQIAAVALGGTVRANPRGRQQGLLPVTWTHTAADDPLLRNLATPRRGVHWNHELVTEPPSDTTVLACTEHGELQAARFASTVWGVQFHPEADDAVIRRWIEMDPSPDSAESLAAVAAAANELEQAWRPLAEAFADRVGSRAGP